MSPLDVGNVVKPAPAPAPMPWPLPPGHGAGRPVGYPPAGWPTLGQLVWTKELLSVLLLVLAAPWIISKLLTRPSTVLTGVGKRLP